MIPENKQLAVARALQAVFNTDQYQSISALSAGLSSALLYRIEVGGNAYVLRIITRDDDMADPGRWFPSMMAAADAGIAPKVFYTNTTDRVCITNYVAPQPFPTDKARSLLPGLLKQVHALAPFAKRLNYLDWIDGVVRKFEEASIVPAHITADVFWWYHQMGAAYPRGEKELVSCHNDLKPDNILFDGAQAWLIDWEGAFLNDRFTDLAVVANFVVSNDEEEAEYLGHYFGSELSSYHHARFWVMQQMMHTVYFTFFMQLAQRANHVIDATLPIPDFVQFHQQLWEGKMNLLDPIVQQQYAWVHLKRLNKNLSQPRLQESMAVLNERPET